MQITGLLYLAYPKSQTLSGKLSGILALMTANTTRFYINGAGALLLI